MCGKKKKADNYHVSIKTLTFQIIARHNNEETGNVHNIWFRQRQIWQHVQKWDIFKLRNIFRKQNYDTHISPICHFPTSFSLTYLHLISPHLEDLFFSPVK